MHACPKCPQFKGPQHLMQQLYRPLAAYVASAPSDVPSPHMQSLFEQFSSFMAYFQRVSSQAFALTTTQLGFPNHFGQGVSPTTRFLTLIDHII